MSIISSSSSRCWSTWARWGTGWSNDEWRTRWRCRWAHAWRLPCRAFPSLSDRPSRPQQCDRYPRRRSCTTRRAAWNVSANARVQLAINFSAIYCRCECRLIYERIKDRPLMLCALGLLLIRQTEIFSAIYKRWVTECWFTEERVSDRHRNWRP